MAAIWKQIPDWQEELLNETRKYKFNNILDIWFWNWYASDFFLKQWKKVTATWYDINYYHPDKELLSKINVYENISVEDMSCFEDNSFDAVWFSYVLEHCPNTWKTLSEIRRVLKPNWLLFISVPSFWHYIVWWPINTWWNIWLLMYNLVLNKFNIKQWSFIKHKNSCIAFVYKDINIELWNLRHDNWDIETLSCYFPDKHNTQWFFWNFREYNRKWKYYKNHRKDLYKTYIRNTFIIAPVQVFEFFWIKENIKNILKFLSIIKSK
jgi:SAM-dependent methyltransferase